MSKANRHRDRYAQLDALYAELPTVVCQGRCSIACGPITLTDLEAERVRLAAHQKPRTIAVTAVDASGNTMRERCVYLAQDRCRVYAQRPFICRAWGVMQMLSCMHGCQPDRWLSSLEFLRIAQAIERLGGGRILRTSVDGLGGSIPGERYADFTVTRSAEHIARTAQRTRDLRALHGGRIIRAESPEEHPLWPLPRSTMTWSSPSWVPKPRASTASRSTSLTARKSSSS